VEGLLGPAPALAQRIGRFRTYQVGILFEFLKGQRQAAALPPGPATPPGAADGDLTVAELRAIAQASRLLWRPGGSPPSFADFRVHLVGEVAPALARKLARFSDRQTQRLFRQVQERRWRP
jgi:hypothetical protein